MTIAATLEQKAAFPDALAEGGPQGLVWPALCMSFDSFVAGLLNDLGKDRKTSLARGLAARGALLAAAAQAIDGSAADVEIVDVDPWVGDLTATLEAPESCQEVLASKPGLISPASALITVVRASVTPPSVSASQVSAVKTLITRKTGFADLVCQARECSRWSARDGATGARMCVRVHILKSLQTTRAFCSAESMRRDFARTDLKRWHHRPPLIRTSSRVPNQNLPVRMCVCVWSRRLGYLFMTCVRGFRILANSRLPHVCGRKELRAEGGTTK